MKKVRNTLELVTKYVAKIADETYVANGRSSQFISERYTAAYRKCEEFCLYPTERECDAAIEAANILLEEEDE